MRRKDETAFDYLDRITGWMKHEVASLVQDLPTTQAIIDYFELWSHPAYDTDFMQGIEAAIHEGADPQPLRDFVAKHKLEWDLSWIDAAKVDGDDDDAIAEYIAKGEHRAAAT